MCKDSAFVKMRNFVCLAITVLLLGFVQIGQAQIATFDLELNDLLKMQEGLGWPKEMVIAEGQEALMKLTSTLANQQSCVATTPAGETFDVSSPPNSRYESWSDGCGIRVKEIVESDTGRWRLTATAGTQSIMGWTEVEVQADIPEYTAPAISLQDGDTQTQLELTTLENSYCLVAQPFSASSLVTGPCRVTLDKTTRAVQGNWDILVGIPGRVSELHVQRHVAVEAERLDVGFQHDTNTNKVNLYCNILHTTKNVTFCRFQRTTDSWGYNVMEGLSDGTHSYYGDGFVAKHCGMTIENPTARDYGTWRCSVGSQQWIGTALEQQTPMQALINVIESHRNARARRDLRSEAEEDVVVLVQEGRTFTVSCSAEVSLSYCWFMHPSGSYYSPLPLTSEDQTFWYAGESLQFGDCGITFSQASETDAGDWVCHMGASNQPGVELTDRVSVRVTGPLAANKNEIEVTEGESTTLYCRTANGIRPLDYCRFLSPTFVGFNIDSSITDENPILDRFYFTANRSLVYGDCSLTISQVLPEDIGTWTCASLINNDAMESSDTIRLFMQGEHEEGSTQAPLSRAGIAGMAIGIFALVVLLVGVVWHNLGRPIPWRRRNPGTESTSIVAFDNMSMNTSTAARSSIGNSSRSSDDTSSGSEIEVNVGVSTPQFML